MKKCVCILFAICFTALIFTACRGKNNENENGKNDSPPGNAENTAKNTTEGNETDMDDFNYDDLNVEYEVLDENNPVATIIMENNEFIIIELYPGIAPITVNNFITLANGGYYDGLIFHRVIQNFMIQGGDPLGTGRGGPGYCIFGEFTNNGFENNLKHTRGVISMARKGDLKNPAPYYDTAGSQFFICVTSTSSLDDDYASFGKVVYGMDTVDGIVMQQKNADDDKPLIDQMMKKVIIDTKGVEYPEPEKLTEK